MVVTVVSAASAPSRRKSPPPRGGASSTGSSAPRSSPGSRSAISARATAALVKRAGTPRLASSSFMSVAARSPNAARQSAFLVFSHRHAATASSGGNANAATALTALTSNRAASGSNKSAAPRAHP